jgi:hypothetical protein
MLTGVSTAGREDVLDTRDGVRWTSEEWEVRTNLDADGALSTGSDGAERLRDGGTTMVGGAHVGGSTSMASSLGTSF